MNIKLRTYFWNKEKTKILWQSKTNVDDEELCQLINERFISGEYSIPMHLSKENVIFETQIDEIKL